MAGGRLCIIGKWVVHKSGLARSAQKIVNDGLVAELSAARMGTMPCWIESHADLENHPKMLLVKSRMRWSKNETVGFLHRFWWTVLKYAPHGVISALSLEVVSETLDMKLDDLKRVMNVMEQPDVNLLERFGDELVVHDWLDFAGTYLRDSLYRRKPEKWKEVQEIYKNKRSLSADCQPTVSRLSAVPTNQPTNQPTGGFPDSGGMVGIDPASRLANELGLAMNCGPKQIGDLKALIAVDGYEHAEAAAKKALAKGIGGGACITYALKVVAGEKAKRDLSKSPSKPGSVTRFEDN